MFGIGGLSALFACGKRACEVFLFMSFSTQEKVVSNLCGPSVPVGPLWLWLVQAKMAAVQTTIKTELCSFCEYRIYPGRGQKFVSRDGKVHTFIHSKQARLGRQKLKAAKLRWTLVS